jgi:hypothetical protein
MYPLGKNAPKKKVLVFSPHPDDGSIYIYTKNIFIQFFNYRIIINFNLINFILIINKIIYHRCYLYGWNHDQNVQIR